MKKVLVITSSPRRKGNSDILCNQFIKGTKEAGNQVEKINLNDYQMGCCKACDYCRSHNNDCVIKDQANTVIEKIINSDVILFATPVYFYGVSAQLKILMDRFYAREYEIRNSEKQKDSYLLITSGSPNKEDMLGVIATYQGFVKVLKTINAAGIIYGLGAFNRGDANNHPAYNEAYIMGKSI